MRFLFAILILLATSPGFALFCPTNFNLINIGDPIEKVLATCGKPTSEETKLVDKEVPEEWNYYVPQTMGSNTPYQQVGTLKTTISFDKNGLAVNINVNGIGIGSSTICGPIIQLGQTREQVKAACGTPSLINKQQDNASNGKPEQNKIVTYRYDSTPPMTLTFENGILTSATSQ